MVASNGDSQITTTQSRVCRRKKERKRRKVGVAAKGRKSKGNPLGSIFVHFYSSLESLNLRRELMLNAKRVAFRSERTFMALEMGGILPNYRQLFVCVSSCTVVCKYDNVDVIVFLKFQRKKC